MPTILVIDDEPAIQHILARILGIHGMSAQPAHSTHEALKALAGQKFDAVFIDIVLGRENGWETLRQVRESSDVPVIMMSGVCVDDDMRLDAEKLGAQAVLQKPFTSNQILGCITGVLRKTPGR